MLGLGVAIAVGTLLEASGERKQGSLYVHEQSHFGTPEAVGVVAGLVLTLAGIGTLGAGGERIAAAARLRTPAIVLAPAIAPIHRSAFAGLDLTARF